MNNYNLSNIKLLPLKDLFTDKLSNGEIDYTVSKYVMDYLLYKIELEPKFKYLDDGRVIEVDRGKLVNNNNNTFIYEVSKSDGNNVLCLTINDLVKELNTNRTSLNRRLINPVMEDN